MGFHVPAGIFANARDGDAGKEAGKDGREQPIRCQADLLGGSIANL